MKQQRTCGLEGLPSRQREAYELHLEGLTAPDIAKRMGVGNARAYELIALARKKLVPPRTEADSANGAESNEIRTASRSEMIKLIGDKALRILESMDSDAIKKAHLRDKAVAYGILLDKQRLLQGEPTQILTVQNREKLNAVVGIMMKEAKRRGIRFAPDGTVEDSPNPETRH